MPRFFVDAPLAAAGEISLPPGAARHVQVLRLQPGMPLLLFNGGGGEHEAVVSVMGRRGVEVMVGAHRAVDRELAFPVTLALGMPANDRMDALVEKATELGVAAIQPLVCERSVLRLAGERAERRREHWQGIAVAAAEQSGRTRVPQVAPVLGFAQWLGGAPACAETLWMLSLGDQARAAAALEAPASLCVLSGPEGGLAPAEAQAARDAGFAPVSLGPRVLRADTAPLALLAFLGLRA